MKPLSEWTDDEIDRLLRSWDNYERMRELIDELLHRQKGRCAAVCREVVDERRSYDFLTHGFFWSEAAGAEECEHRIRVMK